MFNILYASADAVVCTSDTLKRRISARRRSAKGVFKITNGARLELIRPLTESERRAVRRRYGVQGELVVFTGTLSSHQAPWNLVDAARELRSRGVKTSVVVAGGGPLLEELKRRSAEQGKPVRFVGSLSRDEATKLIAASDIGVITLRDSVACRSMIPLKFFDYVAGSLPIAASVPEDSEIAQMIIEEKLGIVVEPEDPIRLADAIEEMIKNKDSRLMSKKNAEEIAPRYDWRNLAETYLDLFFDLARRGTD
jgi:glycosyltransferase involved in cell wall biosynthesis